MLVALAVVLVAVLDVLAAATRVSDDRGPVSRTGPVSSGSLA
jgi:hypothetical protein